MTTVAAPRSDGRSVVLVQGFGLPTASLRPLRTWLEAGGWRVAVPRLGLNVACGTAAVDRVLACCRGERAAAGRPTVVVGHSRGGLLGLVAAHRGPDAIDGLVTICTPWALGAPDRPGVHAVSAAVRWARRRGVDVLGSIECDRGPCCTAFREEMRRPPAVPWTCLWSSVDRIGGADAAPPERAGRVVDLGSSHLGALRSPATRAALAAALADPPTV